MLIFENQKIEPEKQKLLRFELGLTVASSGALKELEKAGVSPLRLLGRHQSGDWGDLSDGYIAENEFSLKEGFRLLSAYKLETGVKIWIITEADRSVTILLTRP